MGSEHFFVCLGLNDHRSNFSIVISLRYLISFALFQFRLSLNTNVHLADGCQLERNLSLLFPAD